VTHRRYGERSIGADLLEVRKNCSALKPPFAIDCWWPERADRLEAREQPLGATPDGASDCFKNALGSTGPGHLLS